MSTGNGKREFEVGEASVLCLLLGASLPTRSMREKEEAAERLPPSSLH